jgi:putative transcriptional regulator
MDTVSLVNHFLIAMPAMDDPNFSRTLTYICEHNADGAIGIIVNRPTDLNLAGLFDRVSIPLDDEQAEARFGDLPVYFGGPVQTDRGFVLHRPAGQLEWELSQNSWLTVAAEANIIFTTPPEERLPAAMQLLGIDFARLSEVAGHA